MTTPNAYPGIHWRISLRLRGSNGKPDRTRELHRDRPIPDAGMQRTARRFPRRTTILIGVCWRGDECEKYNSPDGGRESGDRETGERCEDQTPRSFASGGPQEGGKSVRPVSCANSTSQSGVIEDAAANPAILLEEEP